jgi:hypothetical protein
MSLPLITWQELELNVFRRQPHNLYHLRLSLAPLGNSAATVIGLRLGLGLVAFFTYILLPQSEGRLFQNPGPETQDMAVLYNRMLTMWSNWDGNWYLLIAKEGYEANPDLRVFFPLFPLLIKMLGTLLLNQYLLAGIIISTIMSVVVLALLHEMVKRDYDNELAEKTVFYLAIFPTVFYFFAVYTEALFLALVLGSIFAARHLRLWWLSGLLGALATLTRNLGVFVVFSLIIEWILYRYSIVKQESRADVKLLDIRTLKKMFHPTILAVALPVVSFAGWLLYNQLEFGSAFGSVTSQSNWSRQLAPPWTTIIESLRVIFAPSTSGFAVIKIDWYQGSNLLDLSFFTFAVIMFVIGAWKLKRGQLPLSYFIYFGFCLLVPLLAPAQFTPLMSFPRYLLPMFPMFILWAQLCQNRNWLHYVTLYLWLPLLGILFALFANGYWIA